MIPASLKEIGLIHFELIEVKLCKQSASAVLNRGGVADFELDPF